MAYINHETGLLSLKDNQNKLILDLGLIMSPRDLKKVIKKMVKNQDYKSDYYILTDEYLDLN